MYKYIFFLLITSITYSQRADHDPKLSQQDDNFKKSLHYLNGVFNVPEGYKLEPLNIEYTWCWDDKLEGGIQVTLSNANENILVGIIIEPFSQERLEMIRKNYNPDRAVGDNYNAQFRTLPDTINYPVCHFGEAYVKNKLKADRAVMFTRGCTRPYKEKYRNNKIVLMGKYGHGFFQVDFLYTDSVEKMITKEIKRVLPLMVKFKG